MVQKPTLQKLAEQVEALQALANERKLAVEALRAQVEGLKREIHPRLHIKDVLRRYGISRATLYRLLRRRRLPRPIYVSGPAWRLADLDRAEASGQAPRPLSR